MRSLGCRRQTTALRPPHARQKVLRRQQEQQEQQGQQEQQEQQAQDGLLGQHPVIPQAAALLWVGAVGGRFDAVALLSVVVLLVVVGIKCLFLIEWPKRGVT